MKDYLKGSIKVLKEEQKKYTCFKRLITFKRGILKLNIYILMIN